jgi:hypothetical protein
MTPLPVLDPPNRPCGLRPCPPGPVVSRHFALAARADLSILEGWVSPRAAAVILPGRPRRCPPSRRTPPGSPPEPAHDRDRGELRFGMKRLHRPPRPTTIALLPDCPTNNKGGSRL